MPQDITVYWEGELGACKTPRNESISAINAELFGGEDPHKAPPCGIEKNGWEGRLWAWAEFTSLGLLIKVI